jgi:hypothetical protein
MNIQLDLNLNYPQLVQDLPKELKKKYNKYLELSLYEYYIGQNIQLNALSGDKEFD